MRSCLIVQLIKSLRPSERRTLSNENRWLIVLSLIFVEILELFISPLRGFCVNWMSMIMSWTWTGLLRLRHDVRACEYEDVHVMWEMLKRNETERYPEKSNKGPFLNFFGWARCTPYLCRSFQPCRVWNLLSSHTPTCFVWKVWMWIFFHRK